MYYIAKQQKKHDISSNLKATIVLSFQEATWYEIQCPRFHIEILIASWKRTREREKISGTTWTNVLNYIKICYEFVESHEPYIMWRSREHGSGW